MRFVFGTIILVSIAAWGQVLVSPDRTAKIAGYFEAQQDDKLLRCEVRPIPPHLNFSFRFQAGYVVRVPLNQYPGAGHSWTILTRIVPEGGQPVYLASRMRLPTIPKTKAAHDFGGVYAIGEGRYAVDWMMFDDSDRVCRKSWRVDARLDSKERDLNLGIAPATVSDVSFRRWSSGPGEGTGVRPLRRLTVLLHAAPLAPQSTRLRAYDRVILLSALSSLLESLPTQAVRLVIFNLDQQRELFREDPLTPDMFDRVAQSMNLELGLVDYRVLQNRRGHIDLLADLINREVQAADPPDAVVVLGPATRYYDKVPEAIIEAGDRSTTRFFYLQYSPPWKRGAEWPDSIVFALRKVRGKVIVIHSPDEFARAILQIRPLLPSISDPH